MDLFQALDSLITAISITCLEQSNSGSGENGQRSDGGGSAARLAGGNAGSSGSAGGDGAGGGDNGVPDTSTVGLGVQVDEGEGHNAGSAVVVVALVGLAVVLAQGRGDDGDFVDVALNVVDPVEVQSTKLGYARCTNADGVFDLSGVVVVLLLGLESGSQSGLQGNFSTVQPTGSAHRIGIQLDVELDVFRLELFANN